MSTDKIRVISSVVLSSGKETYIQCALSDGSVWSYHPYREKIKWDKEVPSYDELTEDLQMAIKNTNQIKK